MTASPHPDALNALLYADNGAPGDVLGLHDVGDGSVSLRVFRPDARELAVVDEASDVTYAMTRTRDEGFFEAVFPADPATFRYHLRATAHDGTPFEFHDPYDARRFPYLLSDLDLYLYGEGKLVYAYEKLGAHIRTIDGVSGVNFAVWAPNARRLSVVGSFNSWDARVHPMLPRSGGVWELFVPGIGANEVYRYDVRSHHMGYNARKSDPFGFYAELRPANASITYDITQHLWQDDTWMRERVGRDPLPLPMSIYEMHLGSWRRDDNGNWLNYREIAHQLADYLNDMGYTHVELLPVAEHPFDASWGYQVTGYFAPTSRYGTPDDFMYFVEHLHQHGIGIILDWVPAHFPKDGHALSFFDGTHLYEHEDPRRGEHPDWGTYIFNFGRNEVRNFLVSNALFWLLHYHIDGLRVDAVTSMLMLSFSRNAGEWLPNQYGGEINLEALSFLQEFNEVVHREAPGTFTIAEESSSYPKISRPVYVGGVGFTFKWNMGWMHDTLDYMEVDPFFRRFFHNKMTFSLMYAFSENYVLALSHDEVVHLKKSLLSKMPRDWWQQFASLRVMFGYMFGHPGKKLNFMGSEFGVWNEWSETGSLDWNLLDWPTHRGLQAWMRAMNHLYTNTPALYDNDYDWSGFEWVQVNDIDNSIFAFLRRARNPDDFILVVTNFTPEVRRDYVLGVPVAGVYCEALNSDSAAFGGGDIAVFDQDPYHERHSDPGQWGAFSNTLRLTIPPLACVFIRLARSDAQAEALQSSEMANEPIYTLEFPTPDAPLLLTESSDAPETEDAMTTPPPNPAVPIGDKMPPVGTPPAEAPPASTPPPGAPDTGIDPAPKTPPVQEPPVKEPPVPSETPMDLLAEIVEPTMQASDTPHTPVPNAVTAANAGAKAGTKAGTKTSTRAKSKPVAKTGTKAGAKTGTDEGDTPRDSDV